MRRKRAQDMNYFIAAVALSSALATFNAVGEERLDLSMLQGAWWDNEQAPTAAFSIRGSEVWIDSARGYLPCRLEGDVLIFEIDSNTAVRNRVISIEADVLLLRNLNSGFDWRLKRLHGNRE